MKWAGDGGSWPSSIAKEEEGNLCRTPAFQSSSSRPQLGSVSCSPRRRDLSIDASHHHSMSSTDLLTELDLLVRSRYALIIPQTSQEARAEALPPDTAPLLSPPPTRRSVLRRVLGASCAVRPHRAARDETAEPPDASGRSHRYPPCPRPPTSMSTYIPIGRCGSQNKTHVPGFRLTLTVTEPGASATSVMS